jgi:hypothetical protein
MAAVRIHERVLNFSFYDGNLSSTRARKMILNGKIDVRGYGPCTDDFTRGNITRGH